MQIRALAPGVWLHTSVHDVPGLGPFPANGLLVEGEERALLVDTTWSGAQLEQLTSWSRRHLAKPVLGAIVTHAHNDRIGGTRAAQAAGIPVHALSLTVERAESQTYGVPDRTLENPGAQLRIGGVEVHTLWPGHGHAPDNLVVWLPESEILFGGCLVKSSEAEGLGYTSDADISGWATAIHALQERPWTPRIVVPGHGEPGSAQLLDHTATLTSDSP